MKKNSYIEQIISDIQDGKDVSSIKHLLSYAYQQAAYTKNGMICIDNAIHSAKDAVALAQELSLAGINELYITGEWSNQFEAWMAMDSFGLKLQGIVSIDNADYHKDIDRWGDSYRPAELLALKFGFTADN